MKKKKKKRRDKSLKKSRKKKKKKINQVKGKEGEGELAERREEGKGQIGHGLGIARKVSHKHSMLAVGSEEKVHGSQGSQIFRNLARGSLRMPSICLLSIRAI